MLNYLTYYLFKNQGPLWADVVDFQIVKIINIPTYNIIIEANQSHERVALTGTHKLF